MAMSGISLVVFVYAATLMLSSGIQETLSHTGAPSNVIVIRAGAQNEIQSGLTRDNTAIILSQPELALDLQSRPVAATELVVLVSLLKRSDGGRSNVTIRGISSSSLRIRPEIILRSGRLPNPGTQEVIIGNAIYDKFQGTEVNKVLRLAGTDWQIVGIHNAGNSGFSSEIWGDAEVLMAAFRRDKFSNITARLATPDSFSALKQRLESDPRLSVTVSKEQDFYASQSHSLSLFITTLGTFVSVIFSIGAMIGALITMYSTISYRTREIAILRALGFSRFAIFSAFLKEALCISTLGGAIGLIAASLLSFFSLSTTNFSTFSEVSFRLHFSLAILCQGMIFSLIMGLLGGVFPAYRASRLKLVSALRL